MTKQQLEALLQNVRTWPEEDQQQLVEVVRDIEARRCGSYTATQEELAAIDEAERSDVVESFDVDAAFKEFRRL